MGLFDPIDWNGDGKYDFFDDLLEFAIFQECMKDKNDLFDEDFEDFDDDTEEDW